MWKAGSVFTVREIDCQWPARLQPGRGKHCVTALQYRAAVEMDALFLCGNMNQWAFPSAGIRTVMLRST